MAENAFLIIGKVVGVHGVKGTIRVYSDSESDDAFSAGSILFLTDTRGEKKTYTVKWAKPHARVMLVCLEGIDHRDVAEPLVGCLVSILRESLPDLEEGVYYWFELIGLAVFSETERYIGSLESIIQTGSNDVYVVRDGDAETLVPALASVVIDIDLEAGRMVVALPQGL